MAMAVVLAGAAAITSAAGPAHAAGIRVDDLQFRWGLNDESNNAAYAPGTVNLFSAGKVGNPGAGGQTLSDADQGATWSNGATAGWKARDGNVVIEKQRAGGDYAPTTWAGTRTDPSGNPVTVNGATFTDHQVVIDHGTGTLDAAGDDADIAWTGDFTALYYSGMTYFTVSDPHLTVTDGRGVVTATLGGYAADMNDLSRWSRPPDTVLTPATPNDFDGNATGLQATPDYAGVAYDAPVGATPQTPRADANAGYWGSFPQSFVDFQQETGSSSYWYASGGSADARKVPLPLYAGTPIGEPPPAAKATTDLTVRITTKPTRATKGKATVTVVSADGATAAGKVTLVLQRDKATKKVTATLHGGRATLALPKLARGTWRLTATYAGSTRFKPSTGKTTVKVGK